MCRPLALVILLALVAAACGGGGDSAEQPIIFVAAGREDRSDIFAVDPTTGEITNLTDNPAHDFAAALSPDGSKIAFFSTRDNENPAVRLSPALYVMNVDGSYADFLADVHRLNPETAERIAWNPDGDRLLFTGPDRQPVIVDLNGVVYEPPISVTSGTWSRGGQRLLSIAGDEDSPTRVSYWAIDPYTLQQERLFPFGILDYEEDQPCDSPDLDWQSGWTLLYGSLFSSGFVLRIKNGTGQVLYTSERCETGIKLSQVFSRDAAFQHERMLTNEPSSKYGPRWSPDGEKVAYMNQTADGPSVWTMNADGSNQTLIATDAGQPVWSPDGKTIAYGATTNPGSYRRDEFAIFLANADGSDARILTDDAGWVSELLWSPVE